MSFLSGLLLIGCLWADETRTSASGKGSVASPRAGGRSATIGAVHVTIETTPARVALSDPLMLSLFLIAPENVETRVLDHPGFDRRWQVISRSSLGPDRHDHLSATRIDIRLEPLALGSVPLGTLALEQRRPNEAWQRAPLTLPTLEILPANPSAKETSPLRPPPALTNGSSDQARLSRLLQAAGIVIILGAAVGVLLLRRPGRPARLARRTLETLGQKLEAAQLQPRQVLHQTNHAVRLYVESELGVPMINRTTPEVVNEVRLDEVLSPSSRRQLRGLLVATDPERFRATEPTLAMARAALVQALDFIRGEVKPQ